MSLFSRIGCVFHLSCLPVWSYYLCGSTVRYTILTLAPWLNLPRNLDYYIRDLCIVSHTSHDYKIINNTRRNEEFWLVERWSHTVSSLSLTVRVGVGVGVVGLGGGGGGGGSGGGGYHLWRLAVAGVAGVLLYPGEVAVDAGVDTGVVRLCTPLSPRHHSCNIQRYNTDNISSSALH